MQTSYSNPGGSGDRRDMMAFIGSKALIQGQGTSGEIDLSAWIDGTYDNSYYMSGNAVAGHYYLFDFKGKFKYIDQIHFIGNGEFNEGIFKWQGSNDKKTWTTLSTLTLYTNRKTDVKPGIFKYFRLLGHSGVCTTSGWQQQFEFKIDDVKDVKYYFTAQESITLSVLEDVCSFPVDIVTFDDIKVDARVIVNGTLVDTKENLKNGDSITCKLPNHLIFLDRKNEIIVKLSDVDGNIQDYSDSVDINFIAPTSYNNPCSTGDRRNLMKAITTTGYYNRITSDEPTIEVPYLIDGNNGNNIDTNVIPCKDHFILFDFKGVFKYIDQFQYNTSSTGPQGVFKWQGSNDGETWVDIATVELLMNVPINVPGAVFRYFRLLGISGNGNNGPWIYEMNFKIGDIDILSFKDTYIDKSIIHIDELETISMLNINGILDIKYVKLDDAPCKISLNDEILKEMTLNNGGKIKYPILTSKLNYGENVLKLSAYSGDIEVYNKTITIYKIDRDTFTYSLDLTKDRSLPIVGDGEYTENGYGLSTRGKGEIIVDIPTDGKSKVSSINIISEGEEVTDLDLNLPIERKREMGIGVIYESIIDLNYKEINNINITGGKL